MRRRPSLNGHFLRSPAQGQGERSAMTASLQPIDVAPGIAVAILRDRDGMRPSAVIFDPRRSRRDAPSVHSAADLVRSPAAPGGAVRDGAGARRSNAVPCGSLPVLRRLVGGSTRDRSVLAPVPLRSDAATGAEARGGRATARGADLTDHGSSRRRWSSPSGSGLTPIPRAVRTRIRPASTGPPAVIRRRGAVDPPSDRRETPGNTS